MLEGEIAGPESILLLDSGTTSLEPSWEHPLNRAPDSLLTGLKTGEIVLIQGGVIAKRLRVRPASQCGAASASWWWEGEGREGALSDGSYDREPECGRPLGLRMDEEGSTWVADAYAGIIRFDIHKGISALTRPVLVLVALARFRYVVPFSR